MKSKRNVQNEKWHRLYTGLTSVACFERFLNGCFTLELTPVYIGPVRAQMRRTGAFCWLGWAFDCRSGKEVLNGLFSFA